MSNLKSEKPPLDSPLFDEFPQFRKAMGDWKPRMAGDICLLCQASEASKKQSHILPDFFTKNIFRDPSKRRYLVTNGLAVTGKPSSTPKEAYLLCNICEEKLGALEQVISLVLPKMLEELRSRDDFSSDIREHHLESIGIEPALFHLFAYSLLWRAHVTQKTEFTYLTLSDKHAEELRQTLNTCLHTKKESMIEAMVSLYPDRLPVFYQTMMVHKKPRNESQTIIGIGWSYDSNYGYRLYSPDFLFKFSASDEDISMEPRGATQLGSVVAINPNDWQNIVFGMVNDITRINKEVLNVNESSHLRKGFDQRQRPDQRKPTP
jgi:hypothetical protein